MKLPLILAALILGSLSALGETADEHYRNGMSAIARGDGAAAQASFKEALKLDPNHANSRYQLNRLPNIKGDLVAKQRAAKLNSIKIGEINFQEVSLSDALMALGQMVETESAKTDKKNPFNPNFMIQDPKGKLGDSEVTLQLKGVPAGTALKYMLEQAGGSARFDAHATVIRPAK